MDGHLTGCHALHVRRPFNVHFTPVLFIIILFIYIIKLLKKWKEIYQRGDWVILHSVRVENKAVNKQRNKLPRFLVQDDFK